MDRRELLLAIGGAAVAGAVLAPSRPAQAQSMHMEPAIAGNPRGDWIAKAESLKPVLTETSQLPISIVRAVADPSVALRYRMEAEAPADTLAARPLKKNDSFILDFGGHRTGYLSFSLQTQGREPDSPARLRFTFGEVPTDVAESLYPYHGELSSAWLPDETVNIDYLPQRVRLTRRYAFRYVKVEVLDTSPGFQVLFQDFKAHAVSSAVGSPSLISAAPEFQRIDEVALATLRDCMQTSFEDGPRRDRRLWIGDMRLQALTNYVSFKSNDLVKRCLYLFAAFPRTDGLLGACVFEQPQPRYGGIHIMDYAVLFNVALLEYLEATGDHASADELWPVAKRQLEIVGGHVNEHGLFVDPGNVWVFIDWAPALHKDAAMQSLLIFAYKKTLELAMRLGRAREVGHYSERIERMTRAARHAYWNASPGLVISGKDHQVSWASAAWMVIGGILTPAEGSRALSNVINRSDAVRPVTPYLYHYMVEALLMAGMRVEARSLLSDYWGAMVRAGADTFWEIFDPKQPLSSPYGDIHINSYCHAWSCTPSYLFRAKNLLQ